MTKEEKPDLTQATEEECPACGSDKVERTGLSHQVPGIDENIQFKCGCGHVFHVYEHFLKPLKKD